MTTEQYRSICSPASVCSSLAPIEYCILDRHTNWSDLKPENSASEQALEGGSVRQSPRRHVILMRLNVSERTHWRTHSAPIPLFLEVSDLHYFPLPLNPIDLPVAGRGGAFKLTVPHSLPSQREAPPEQTAQYRSFPLPEHRMMPSPWPLHGGPSSLPRPHYASLPSSSTR